MRRQMRAATLMLCCSLYSVMYGAVGATPTTGDDASVLINEKGQPNSKRITNAEDHPLKGELWTYSSNGSRQDYLIRDGKIRWLRETPEHANAFAEVH